MKVWGILALALVAAGCAGPTPALTIGTTTTTQDTGLLDALLPSFERDTGIHGRAVVAGTGELIEKAQRGDVDVLFTHSPARERALVENGTAVRRQPVMFNRFVVAGPTADAAGVRNAASAASAFERVHANRSTFVSRGDRSGTHDRELAIWASAGLQPSTFGTAWYKETGTGQGTTLSVASEWDAYLLVDEATLLQFHANGKAHNIIAFHTNDPVLRNQYAIVQLAPDAHQRTNAEAFAQWITGAAGQAVIRAFTIAGQPAFTPNAEEHDA